MVEKSQTCLTCMNSVVKHAHGSQNESYVYIPTISNKAERRESKNKAIPLKILNA